MIGMCVQAAMVAAGYPTVDAAAREDGSAEAGEPGLRQLSGAVEASAASHVATAASAASSSPPQPDHCISSFEKEKAFSTMIQDSRQPAAHGHTNQADEEDNDVAM